MTRENFLVDTKFAFCKFRSFSEEIYVHLVKLGNILASVSTSSKGMTDSPGVFIRCNESKDRECLTSIQSLMKPFEKIIGAKRDHTYNGLKIFFKDTSTVRNILRERYLEITGERFSIHALTTTLIVHTEIFDFEPKFAEDLRNGIKQMGPILEAYRLRMFDDIVDSYNGDWKFVLDVPEIEDLEVFNLKGSPNNMILKLHDFEKGFRMTFRCSYCDQNGHTLRRCTTIGNLQSVPERQAATQSSRIDSLYNEGVEEPETSFSSSKRAVEFRIRNREEETNAESKPTLSQNDIESLARKFGEERVRQEFINPLSTNANIEVKKEFKLDPENRYQSLKRLPDGNQHRTPTKIPRGLSVTCASTSYNSEAFQHNPGPSVSNWNDDDLQLISQISPRSTNLNNFGLSRSINQEDAGQVSTSSRTDGINESIKSELPSTDENDSDSNSHPPQAVATGQVVRRRKPTQIRQIKIPDSIKGIMKQNPGVLSEERLEAFLNHVKKKSRPSAVAKQYTEDVQALKAQLQSIKSNYYNTPVFHNPDEKYFMKWFENVLERFDNKPYKKIKSSDQKVSLEL